MSKQTKRIQTLSITAKCSDAFIAILREQGIAGGLEYTGYVPTWLPCPGSDEDYIRLEIDVATGQILNWKKPTQAQLNETFSE